VAAAAPDPFQHYLRVQRKYDAKVIKILNGAARDLTRRINSLALKPGVGAQVRAAQLRLARAAIQEEMRDMWASVGLTIPPGQEEAAKAAEDALDVISRTAYSSLPDIAAQELVDGLRAAAYAGIEAEYARVPRALSEAVYRNAVVSSGQIEDLIRRGLIQGLSARELAASVFQYVSPSTPGGASYAAMRLARTEINNAFHEQQIQVGQTTPGVNGVKWNLSGSHPKPDECNLYAERNVDNLGGGVYRANNVPGKPHPHCLCYLTYVTMTPEQFSTALNNGDFDDELRRRTAINLGKVKA
jgi:hypothetical protein